MYNELALIAQDEEANSDEEMISEEHLEQIERLLEQFEEQYLSILQSDLRDKDHDDANETTTSISTATRECNDDDDVEERATTATTSQENSSINAPL